MQAVSILEIIFFLLMARSFCEKIKLVNEMSKMPKVKVFYRFLPNKKTAFASALIFPY